MRRLRFSIAGLMAMVLAFGVGVAALRNASDLWAFLTFAMALGMLGLAILGAIFRRGDRRAFWRGFLLFGGGYGLLAFGPWFEEQIAPRLATTAMIDLAHARLHPAPIAVYAGGDAVWLDLGNPPVRQPDGTLVKPLARLASDGCCIAPIASTVPVRPEYTFESFRRVGHALLVLLAGLAGGLAARYCRGTSRTVPSETRPPRPDAEGRRSVASTGHA